jgi:hypothetical protein
MKLTTRTVIIGIAILCTILIIYVLFRYRKKEQLTNIFTCDRLCDDTCAVDTIGEEEKDKYSSGSTTNDLLIKNMRLRDKGSRVLKVS